jgi:hypothetical protein
MKPFNFYKNIENEFGVLSSVNLIINDDRLYNQIKNYNFEIVYEEKKYDLDQSSYINLREILKTKQNFYIDITHNTENIFNVSIYYRPNQFNELSLLINQIIKQYKNK